MRTEIISIGTELLLGEIVNTNAHFLAGKCVENGLDVLYQTVVGDDLDQLCEVFAIASERAEIVICTGGLGPTEDDLTKIALARYTGQSLQLHQESEQRIRLFFAQRNVAMTENNIRQALILTQSDALLNEHGLATGVAIQHGKTVFILLPGPPSEMKPMFVHKAMPWIQSRFPELPRLHIRMLCFAGIGESALAEMIHDLIDDPAEPAIATYAKEGEVHVRLSSKQPSALMPAEQEIISRLEAYFYADREMTLEETIIETCTSKNVKLALAESCTGGLIAQLLTKVPGASSVLIGSLVTYSNYAKQHWLQLSLDLLEGEEAPGAISEPVARQMAEHALRASAADFAISVTGVAGPSESEGKPVGLLYIGIAAQETQTETFELRIGGTSRSTIQRRMAKLALYKLWQKIKL